MFVVGSLLMTIDPPFFFCWALATYLAAIALGLGREIADDAAASRWPWIVVGVAVGIGFLAKYSALLWFVGLALFMLLDPRARRQLRSPWPYVSLLVALLFTTQVIVWNNAHRWVTLRHVARQTVTSDEGFSIAEPFVFLGSQIGAVGPTMAVLMIGGIVFAVRASSRRRSAGGTPGNEAPSLSDPPYPSRRALLYLLLIGGSFFVICFITTFFAKVQVNWPAPAYFTLMIVTAAFLASRLGSLATWRPWRGWFWATVVIGLIFLPLAHDPSLLYPVVAKIDAIRHARRPIEPRRFDPTVKLRGYQELGNEVTALLQSLGGRAFVVSDNYQIASELAFYVKGQPKTYYVGSYFALPSERSRFSQFDMWKDRALTPTVDGRPNPLLGRNAVFVGYITDDIRHGFDRVEQVRPNLDIIVRGTKIRTFRLWKCEGFKGIPRPAGGEF
jgi:undecaprenyl-diphosphatase